VLRDPSALALIIPMAMNMKEIAENHYRGDLFFRVGSVAGTFNGTIELSNLEPPKSYEIEVQGRSPVGQVNIKGRMRLESQDNQTTMLYEGNIMFGGRMASVGSRMLDLAIQSTIQQSFKTLNQYLTIKYRKTGTLHHE
ncbi:MAG: hypothetical protein H7175_28000, partial [Burkholderiales bacterium]|nr:hypothetical protein [Anaerolineae bacterium]